MILTLTTGQTNQRGKTPMIKATVEELWGPSNGACLACEEPAMGVEPDAEKYVCESCGEREVYGLEQLMLMGKLEIEDE